MYIYLPECDLFYWCLCCIRSLLGSVRVMTYAEINGMGCFCIVEQDEQMTEDSQVLVYIWRWSTVLWINFFFLFVEINYLSVCLCESVNKK